MTLAKFDDYKLVDPALTCDWGNCDFKPSQKILLRCSKLANTINCYLNSPSFLFPRKVGLMRRFLHGVALLALFTPSLSSAEELRIGSLNIEWLGVPNNRGSIAHGIAQDPADIAEYIKKGNIDILSLEEISDNDEEDADSRTNSTLTQAFDLLNSQAGQDWTHVLFPKKDVNDKNQLVGVAWNRVRVQMVGEPFRLTIFDDPADAFNVWDRHPHAVKFSAGSNKTDLVLVPLHMKSNVGGAAKTRVQRGLEAQLLVAQLTAIRQNFADDDLILLGDTNILKNNEQAAATFVSAGFRDLRRIQENNSSTSGGGMTTDHFSSPGRR